MRDVSAWLADPDTPTCEVYGHRFEDDPDRPGRRVCTAPGCNDEYQEG